MGYAYPSYDSYSSLDNIFNSSDLALLGGVTLIFLFGLLFFTFVYVVVAIIFQGIGIMKMHQNLGLKHGWFAFVPILNSYALGKVAEQYIKVNGKKSARFSIILTILSVVPLIMVCLFFVIVFFVGIVLGASGATPADVEAVTLVIQLGYYLVYFPVIIGISVVQYIALWRIFAIFANKNATLYLVLSIFIGISPFLIFACRNGKPSCVAQISEKKETTIQTL